MRSMVDLWQALVLIATGTLLTLGAGYVQRTWASSDALKGEERESKRRVAAEERKAKRESRTGRMKPVLDFLDVAKRLPADHQAMFAARAAFESLDPSATGAVTWEEFAAWLRADWRTPDPSDLARSYQVALASGPTEDFRRDILAVLFEILVGLRTEGEWRLERRQRIRGAIRSLEDLVERYITEV